MATLLLAFLCLWNILTPRVGMPLYQSSLPAADAGQTVSSTQDPLLQQKITLSVTGQPLSTVLHDLSPTLKVDLTATDDISRQRVTLAVTNEPLSTLMDRLTGLLSHSPDAPSGYHWEKVESLTAQRPAYRLWRDQKSVDEQKSEPDRLKQKAFLMLTEFRDVANLPPREWAKYQPKEIASNWLTDPDDQGVLNAFHGLSNDQLNELMSGQSVPVNSPQLADKIGNYNRLWRTLAEQNRQVAVKAGRPDPYPNGVPETPDTLPSINITPDDPTGEYPEQEQGYQIHLSGVALFPSHNGTISDFGLRLVPTDPINPPFPETDKTPIIDLTPYLTGPKVTAEQKGDMGFTLQALVKASHITLYQEYFYKPNLSGFRSAGLMTLKGTVAQLLNAICDEWRYTGKQVDGEYILWSRDWAQDRAYDIPEARLEQWRKQGTSHGGYTLDDRLQMASALTWPQYNLTLPLAVPAIEQTHNQIDYRVLRVVSGLGVAERQAAFSPDGLTLGALPDFEQQTLMAELGDRLTSSSPQQLAQAKLTANLETAMVTPQGPNIVGDAGAILLTPAPLPQKQVQRLRVRISTNGPNAVVDSIQDWDVPSKAVAAR